MHSSHPYGDRLLFIIKEQFQPFQIFYFFVEQELKLGDIIILIHPWFQACISWRKSVIWWHQFQLSIFSIIESLFPGSTWSVPYVKDTLFISQHLLQPSIITSGLWLIREKLKSMFISGKTLWPCSFKGTYIFDRTSCNNFCLKSSVKCLKALTEIPFFHGECVRQFQQQL